MCRLVTLSPLIFHLGRISLNSFWILSYLINYTFRVFTIIGLFLMVTALGSIRANLSVFGANQYKVPEQAGQLSFYFMLQYFFLKAGTVLGRFVNPLLKTEVNCFGRNDCYALPFGLVAVVMLSGFFILVLGNSFYVKKPPSGNLLLRVCRCIFVSRRTLMANLITGIHFVFFSGWSIRKTKVKTS